MFAAVPKPPRSWQFKFTPYWGDNKQDRVERVADRANPSNKNISIVEGDIQKQELAVHIDGSERAYNAWMAIAPPGSVVRNRRAKANVRPLMAS